MRNRIHLFVFVVLLLLGSGVFLSNCKKAEVEIEEPSFLATGTYNGAYFPTSAWRTCAPEQVGMNSDALLQAYHYADNPNINTFGLVITRHGYIVAEAYFRGNSQSSRFPSYSIAKSFLSAVTGIAIQQGHLQNVDELVSNYLVEWNDAAHEAAKRRMTLRDLLTMSSGLEWSEGDYYDDTPQSDIYWMFESPDYLQYVIAKPSIAEPGTQWYYSSGDSMLISGVLQRAMGRTVYDFARENLLEPIGVGGISWASDDAGQTVGGWGILATVREYAKFGYLYLRRGEWEGQQIVPRQWVDESTAPARSSVYWYGYQWWRASALYGFENSIVPPGTIIAWGIFTQQIFVIPEEDIVIVRVGYDTDPDNDQWRELEFLTLVLNAIN